MATISRRPESRTDRALTVDEMRQWAPSIFATKPWHATSDKYKFIPTTHVIDVLGSRGFLPVRAEQSRSRIDGKEGFTKHVIRFRHADYLRRNVVGSEFPEIILSNAHDGVSAYTLEGGIFRLDCLNGMVVSSASMDRISIRHTSSDHDFDGRVLDVTSMLAESLPAVMQQVNEWRGMPIPEPIRRNLAESATRFRELEVRDVSPILRPRRREDEGRDLWSTVNVVQENIVRGGSRVVLADGRFSRTRAIGSVDSDMRFNRALWKSADTLASMIN